MVGGIAMLLILAGFTVAVLGGVAYGKYNSPGTPVSLGIMIATICTSGTFLRAGGFSILESIGYLLPTVILSVVATLLVRKKGLAQG